MARSQWCAIVEVSFSTQDPVNAGLSAMLYMSDGDEAEARETAEHLAKAYYKDEFRGIQCFCRVGVNATD